MGGDRVQIRGSSRGRQLRPDDVQYSNAHENVLIVCHPSDNAPVDVSISIPHTVRLEATTKDGAIYVSGLLSRAILKTGSGDIRISAPWRLMRAEGVARSKPRKFVEPDVPGMYFVQDRGDPGWRFWSAQRAPTSLFGEIRIDATAPGRIEIVDLPVPADSWVRLPSDAPEALDGMRQKKRKPSGGPAAADRVKPVAPDEATGEAVFTSDVRLVTLAVPVHDREGHPVGGLKAEDFEVLEDGFPQRVAFARSEDAPFNLVLLLDLSGSTLNSRATMMRAARNFVDIARPIDRVAIHALANTLFYVLQPLTQDHAHALDVIRKLPDLTGATPLYDALVLSCAQESLYRMEDRSAVIVLSDGMDNQLEGRRGGSRTSFSRLHAAVAEWPILIYPILLPNQRPAARERMEKLAEASSGRLFEASSIENLAPVYALVAEELRSVYALGYYPRNQDFNGGWRRIQVRVKRPGLVLRTRAGYYAR